MKTRSRLVCILMIAVMIISGMTFTSSAASSPKGKIQVSITQDYAASQTILKEINKQRKKRNLKPLKIDKSLCDAAVQRAAEITIAVPTSTPHNRPDGRLAKTAHKKAIYENCAEANGYKPSAVVNKGWMNSKPHKEGILLKNAKSCGIAAVTSSSGKQYFVAIFSDKKASKVQKSTKKLTLTKTVAVKSKLIKSKYFTPNVEVSYTHKNMEVFPGKTGQMHVSYKGPDSIYDIEILPQSFTWTSSDNSIATIGKNGTIKGIKEGTVTLTGKLKGTVPLSVKCKITVPNSPYTPYEYYDLLKNYVLTNGSSDNKGSICCILGTEGSETSQLTTYMLLVPEEGSDFYTREPSIEFRTYTQNYLNGKKADSYYTSWVFSEDKFKNKDLITLEHYYGISENEEDGWYQIQALEYNYDFNVDTIDSIDWLYVGSYELSIDYDKANEHLKATMKKWDSLLSDKIPGFSMYNMDILSLK